MSRTPVLIVGAGPTGLVLALSLARRGVHFRIVSQANGPGEHSRAIVVHARTLEFYRQFGFGDAVVAQGIPVKRAHLRQGGEDGKGRELAAVSFDGIGRGLSPYPTPLAYPQDDHERFLIEQLEAAGVHVEWEARLTGFTQDPIGVSAALEHGDGRVEHVAADYVCGCDGARSVVRETLRLGFPGGTYTPLHYVVDCSTEGGFEKDVILNLGKRAFVLMLPVRSRGVQRLVGLVPPDVPEREDLSFEDLRALVEPLIGRRVTEVNWFSTYRVHHRVADRFRVDRAFILGDAGHIHSPVGGQGMNTGIGDAINLGWKLAMVIQGRAPAALLDSYEPERIAFARMLVETTDRAFTAVVARGVKGTIVRRVLMPLAFVLGTSVAIARRTMFRLVSQIDIEYEDSALSEGKAGHVAAGDRLPWVADADNFAPLASLDWQAHVYGEPSNDVRRACDALDIPLHAFAWTEAAHHTGLKQDALYLLRPDGYVGFAAEGQDGAGLSDYWSSHQFRMTRAAE